MPYSTVEQVRQVLSPGGSQDALLGTAASLDDPDLEEAIGEADSEIDGRLAGRYTVPFPAPIPAVVETISRDIAAYLATLTYRRGNPVTVDDPVRLRYIRARDMLDQAAKGNIDLTGDAGPIAAGAEAEVVNPYDGELFGLEDMGLSSLPEKPRWQG